MPSGFWRHQLAQTPRQTSTVGCRYPSEEWWSSQLGYTLTGVPLVRARKPATSAAAVRVPITRMSTTPSATQVSTSIPSKRHPGMSSGILAARRYGRPRRRAISFRAERTSRMKPVSRSRCFHCSPSGNSTGTLAKSTEMPS